MSQHIINQYEKNISKIWNLDTGTKQIKAFNYFETLLSEPLFKSHLIEKFSNNITSIELIRSIDHGFILSAYTEIKDQYRQPHNHGNGWVIYGVIDGAMKMKTYEINEQLKEKEVYVLHPRDLKIYLTGQIHDTLGVADKSIVLRFTSCDLKQEERAGRMKKF